MSKASELLKTFDEKDLESELRNLVDGEYESLEGLSKKDFWDWAAGMVDGLTKQISDKVYKSSGL